MRLGIPWARKARIQERRYDYRVYIPEAPILDPPIPSVVANNLDHLDS